MGRFIRRLLTLPLIILFLTSIGVAVAYLLDFSGLGVYRTAVYEYRMQPQVQASMYEVEQNISRLIDNIAASEKAISDLERNIRIRQVELFPPLDSAIEVMGWLEQIEAYRVSIAADQRAIESYNEELERLKGFLYEYVLVDYKLNRSWDFDAVLKGIIIAGSLGFVACLYVNGLKLFRQVVKKHKRNVVRWTTAYIVFTPLLAILAYLLTWSSLDTDISIL